MTKSELIKQIKAFEGFRPVAYADPGKGVLTIGYGRTQNVKQGDTTTREIEDNLKMLYILIMLQIQIFQRLI